MQELQELKSPETNVIIQFQLEDLVLQLVCPQGPRIPWIGRRQRSRAVF